MAKHSVQRKRKKNGNSFSFGRAVVLVLCFIGVSFGLYLWQAAFSIGQPTPTVDDDDFRPTIGEPPYRIVIDAGHGGSDPGARGVVQESEMTAATAEALSAWLERDPNYIPLTIRESYNSTAKPAERAAAANAQDPDLLLSIHGNSAPEGSSAAGFECYPAVPGRAYHQESYYFAKQLAGAMQAAGASLPGTRGNPIHLLPRGSKTAGGEQPQGSAGRAQLYDSGRCKLSSSAGGTVFCDQRYGRSPVRQ